MVKATVVSCTWVYCSKHNQCRSKGCKWRHHPCMKVVWALQRLSRNLN